MKKTILILLSIVLMAGLFVSCNGDIDEALFSGRDKNYKIQADGSWAMNKNVYADSTKPYILVVPKTVDLKQGLTLSDLQNGLVTLETIRNYEGDVKGRIDKSYPIGNAKITFIEADAQNPEYYLYKNEDDEAKAQKIFMRTSDDYSETIQLDAPKDEFSHYGSLNIATVDNIANDSYYEYGKVRKIQLKKLGHIVAETPSEIGIIEILSEADSNSVIDLKNNSVKFIINNDNIPVTINGISTIPQSTSSTDRFFCDGKFYNDLDDDAIVGKTVYLIKDFPSDIAIDKSVKFDLFGNTLKNLIIGNFSSGTASVEVTCSYGTGRVTSSSEIQVTGGCTLVITGGNFAAPNVSEYLADGYTVVEDDNGNSMVVPAKTSDVALSGSSSTKIQYMSNKLSNSYVAPSKDGMKLTGWFTAAQGGTKVLNADGTCVANVSGYTDSSSRWICQNSSVTLYPQWTEFVLLTNVGEILGTVTFPSQEKTDTALLNPPTCNAWKSDGNYSLYVMLDGNKEILYCYKSPTHIAFCSFDKAVEQVEDNYKYEYGSEYGSVELLFKMENNILKSCTIVQMTTYTELEGQTFTPQN